MTSPYTPPDVIVEQRRRTNRTQRQAPMLVPVVVGPARQIIVRETAGAYDVGDYLEAPFPSLAPGAIIDPESVEVLLRARSDSGRPLGIFQLERDSEYQLLPPGADRYTAFRVAHDLSLEYSVLSARNNDLDLGATDTGQGEADGIFFSDAEIDFLGQGVSADGSYYLLIDEPIAKAGRYEIKELIPSGSRVHQIIVEKVNEQGVPELQQNFSIDETHFEDIDTGASRFIYGFPTNHVYGTVDGGDHTSVTTDASADTGVGIDSIRTTIVGDDLDDLFVDPINIPSAGSSDTVIFAPTTGTPGEGAETEAWIALLNTVSIGDWLRFELDSPVIIHDYRIEDINYQDGSVTLKHPDFTGTGYTPINNAAITALHAIRVVRGRDDVPGANTAGDFIRTSVSGVPVNLEVLSARPGRIEISQTLPTLDGVVTSDLVVQYQRGVPMRGGNAMYDLTHRISSNFGGEVIVSYQSQRVDLSLDGLIDIGDQNDIEMKLGLIHPDNPLALGADMISRSGLTDGTRVFYALATDDDTLVSYQAALDVLQTEEVYYVVPLTQDKAVLSLFQSHVEIQSQPRNKHERILLASTELATVDPVLPPTLELPMSQGTVSEANLNRFLISQGLGVVNPGDVLMLMSGPSQADASILHTRRIQTVNAVAGFVETLEPFPASAGDETFYFRIETFPRTKGQQAEEWRDYAQSLRSSRVTLIRPDTCEITYTDKTLPIVRDVQVEVPMYYGCASFAGLCASMPPQQPMTNVQVPGINRLSHSNFYFTPNQLNTIAEGGNNILVQTARNSAPFSRHQLTTDMTSLITRELSIIKLVDFAAKFFRNSLRPYIGNHNITAEYLTQLRGISEAILRGLIEGGVVLEASGLEALYQDQDEPDSVIIEIFLDVPYPANRIKVILFI